MSNEHFLHIAGTSYGWSGKYSVGAYLHEETRKAYLLDSGPDYKTAEMMDREIIKKGYEITAIILSHGHLVNTGGYAYFSKQYPKLRCFASQLSALFIQDSSLLSSLSTSSPLQHLNVNNVESNESIIITDTIPYQDGVFEIGGLPFQVHTLPGHFPGMIGVQTPDQVLFCADALFGKATISRQKLLFFTELSGAKQSLEKLRTIDAKQYMIYHGGIEKNMTELIEENLARMDAVYHDVLTWIEQQWQTSENITQRLMTKYDLENNDKQYDLANIITHSNVRQLLIEGKIARVIKNGILFYKSIPASGEEL